MNLKNKKCAPCEKGKIKPFTKTKAKMFSKEVDGWKLSESGKEISKSYSFNNFKNGMDFVNNVADIAEKEGHHPNIQINYNKVKLNLKTHSIGGLSENDFIVAAKIDAMAKY